MFQDFLYTLRLFRRRPSFSATIVATLAVGIGLTTATYSVVYGVLLRPLRYASPSLLVTSRSVSAGMWSTWQQQTSALDGLALYNMGLAPLVFTGAEPVSLRQAAVSTNFLAVLGVRPIIGRDFESRDADRGAEPVVMLTYGAWQQAFGGRREAVGTIARFESTGRRVIGVLPPDFMFPTRFTVFGDVKALTPLANPLGHEYSASLIARLTPGATLTQARAEELTIARFARGAEPPPTATLTAINDELLGASRPALLMLFGAVGCLLLIGCANVGNLLLAETLADRREFAVRFAVGATRAQVARQVLTRSCTLSVVGGGLGVLLAYWTFDVLRSLVPAQLPRAGDIRIDIPVLAFGLLLSITTGLIVALLPLRHSSRGDFQDTLQRRERATASGRGIRLIVLAAESALAVVLLLGAALFTRSFVRLLSVDVGFAPRNVLTLRVRTLPSRHPTVEQQRAFLDEALLRVRTIAGVSGAGAVELLPLTRARRGGSLLALDGRRANPVDVEPRVVSDGYFEAMGIEVVLGRSFNRQDVSGGPLVAVVNETLARRLWPGENPIGRDVQPPPGSGAVASYDHREVRQVVGVVHDVRLFAVDTKPDPQIYIPYSQSWLVPAQLVVRATGNPMSLAPVVQRAIYELDPRALIENAQPLETQIATSIAQPRFQTWLLLLFGCSGLLLAAVGIGGVVAHSVSSRTREIGIRMALGASPADVIRAVTATSLLAVGIGLSLGFASAAALSRIAQAFLFEISAHDPLTSIVVFAVLLTTALLSAWLPARRAERVDPVVALRAE